MVPEIFKLMLFNRGRSTECIALWRDLLIDMDSKIALLDNYLKDQEVTLIYFFWAVANFYYCPLLVYYIALKIIRCL